MVRRTIMDPVQIGGATAAVMDRIEQIMKARRSATAEWKEDFY
jgi:hypothetical protein